MIFFEKLIVTQLFKQQPAFFMGPEDSLPCSQNPGRTKESVQVRGALKHFVTSYIFYGKVLLAPHPTPKLEDNPL
jgi:hypothetical protein